MESTSDNWREDDEIRGELESLLAAHLGGGQQVSSVAVRPYEYRTTFALEELAVELVGGEWLSLILKDLSRRRLSREARAAKPRFLYEPRREIEAYEAIAEHGVGPTYYGSTIDPDRDRHWLFLEKIVGVELWQVGEHSVWRDVAHWLARFHERLGDLRPPEALVYDGDLYRMWLERARVFTRAEELDRITAAYEQVVERLTGLPQVFLHGEFYPSNVLVSGQAGEAEIWAVDWEMAAVGPGVLDLAALASGWDEKDVVGLVRAYRDGLADPPPEDVFDLGFDCARLHLAIQWLGWASDWQPPEQHAQGWLAEAVRVAERLNL